jgi:hypothetical protein
MISCTCAIGGRRNGVINSHGLQPINRFWSEGLQPENQSKIAASLNQLEI